MKKLIIIVLVLIGLNSCSKDPVNKILGTWTTFDPYYGIREITFSKNKMTIKEYKLGGYPDVEVIREYKIFNNIILVKNYDYRDYCFDSPYFEYFITDDKLFLSGYFGVQMYSKKNKKNLSKKINYLNGEWVLYINDKMIEFLFFNNNVKITEYSNQNNIILENITTFEIDNYYLKIIGLGEMIVDVFYYTNAFLYFIDKDTLCLIRPGGGEIEPRFFYLTKK